MWEFGTWGVVRTYGSPAAPSAISKKVLKEALKEILIDNLSLLATAGRYPDDDAGKDKENSSF